MTVADLARFSRVGDRFEGTLPAEWSQGPGIYGGLLAAAIGDALEQVCGRPLRALSLHLCAPARPGPLGITATEERRGAGVSFGSARMLGPDGLPVGIASATLGLPRTTDLDFDTACPPPIGPPDTLPAFDGVPGAPVFTRRFHMRFLEGVPFTGFAHARSSGWLRPKDPEPMGTALALALLDVWPLAILPRLAAPRPAASVVIHFQLLPPWADPPGPGWCQVAVDSEIAREGWSDQRTSLWDASGRLIGRCQQLTVLR